MAKTGSGIEIRPNSIRMKFILNGVTVKPTFTLNGAPLDPTLARNRKHAEAMAIKIRQRVAAGNFKWADFFPDSPQAKAEAVVPLTFGQAAAVWVKSKGDICPATWDQYNNGVKLWGRIIGNDANIDELTYQRLAALIGEHKWASPKSKKNYLIPLRGVFDFHYAGQRAAANPMAGIRNPKNAVKKQPDPLTPQERTLILADMDKHYDPRIVAYFKFAFFTGMRPQEMIALQWGDVDLVSNTVRIRRVRTFRGSEREGSKTHAERDVDLMPGALQALKMMERYTLLKRDDDGESVDIFENPVTGLPFHDERSQREHYWYPCLARLRMRKRRPYCTRHTYASTALGAGVAPGYIAHQMGHANTKMLHEVYARWIVGADQNSARDMMAALSAEAIQPVNQMGNGYAVQPGETRSGHLRAVE